MTNPDTTPYWMLILFAVIACAVLLTIIRIQNRRERLEARREAIAEWKKRGLMK